jgi:hypothetical protein
MTEANSNRAERATKKARRVEVDSTCDDTRVPDDIAESIGKRFFNFEEPLGRLEHSYRLPRRSLEAAMRSYMRKQMQRATLLGRLSNGIGGGMVGAA